MTEEEIVQRLNKLEQRAYLFLEAKNRRDPSLASHVFFDKNRSWLCHRIDKKTGQDIWCPYYWECMALIGKEMNGEICKDEFAS
jgi:hypothetical protein